MKISFYTTCGNRLQHLSKTLPENIKSNLHYENVEHVVLDYGSTDGLTDYILDTFPEYLKSGRLKYYSYPAKFFWHNHAKNMAAKCTSKDADIICSIDSDNFTGEDKESTSLAQYLYNIFSDTKNRKDFFVRAVGWDYHEDSWGSRKFQSISKSTKYASASGKIAFKRGDFFKMRGFNEDLKGYFYDEEELWRRAIVCWDFERIELPVEFSKFIHHSNYLRLSNLDPNIVAKDTIMDEYLDFCIENTMTEQMGAKMYPQSTTNRVIMHNILREKTKIPNKKNWGTGTPKRIRLKR